MKPTNFSKQLTSFLTEYLPTQRNMSKNTISSYCDAFALLLQYCRDFHGFSIEKITLSNIDRELIDDFLSWLQTERGNSIATSNQRLGAIRSFFKYIQTKSPEHLLLCQKILSLKARKKDHSLVRYLSMDDVKLILSQPDVSTPNGRRDLAMLSLMYDTGARV